MSDMTRVCVCVNWLPVSAVWQVTGNTEGHTTRSTFETFLLHEHKLRHAALAHGPVRSAGTNTQAPPSQLPLQQLLILKKTHTKKAYEGRRDKRHWRCRSGSVLCYREDCNRYHPVCKPMLCLSYTIK